MRIVIALGGNALLRRGDPMTTDVQRQNIRLAAEAITPLAAGHSIVVVHGNGPQVGLLSLQAEAYAGAEPYPLDVLDAGTQGMIGYLIQQELRSILPPEQQVATLLTMIIVDPDDPAFDRPAKFVGPVYHKDAADALAAKKGWAFRQDGSAWRRVVPSPEPRRIVEIQPISWLLERGAVVICAGGGGIPTMLPSSGPGALVGVEAVIDKDLASELLAEDVNADLLVMITAAHLRIRAETGANLPMLVLAIVAAGAVFVTFVFTTLIHEPASIVTLLAIVVLSIGLDYGWKRSRPSSPVPVQVVP
jgi:carbamate kinase